MERNGMHACLRFRPLVISLIGDAAFILHLRVVISITF
jgi:hypothetical protein